MGTTGSCKLTLKIAKSKNYPARTSRKSIALVARTATPPAPTTTIESALKETTTSPWVPANTRVINSELCKLPDQRDPALVNAPRTLGFPLNQTGSKATGTINLVLVAIDFPNFNGVATELTKLDGELKKFDEWLQFQSNGRLKATWQFPQKFFRMPQTAGDYGIVGFDPNTHRQLVSDIVTAADPDINYASVDEMFVYVADSLTDSEPGRNPFDGVLSQFGGTNVSTSEGPIPHVKGSGTVSKQEQYGGIKRTLWALWAHDMLHTIGVEGHNPVESFTLESEDYLNNVASAWNQWLLGWMKDDQVACLDKSEINGMEVDLVPLQSSSSGFRTAIVPITETRAIVVESHRNTGYGANLGASGTLVYLMDTKNVPPYAERENTSLVGSKFLDPDKVTSAARQRVGNGRQSALMLPGEYAAFENLRIEFVRSGTFDKIKFTASG